MSSVPVKRSPRSGGSVRSRPITRLPPLTSAEFTVNPCGPLLNLASILSQVTVPDSSSLKCRVKLMLRPSRLPSSATGLPAFQSAAICPVNKPSSSRYSGRNAPATSRSPSTETLALPFSASNASPGQTRVCRYCQQCAARRRREGDGAYSSATSSPRYQLPSPVCNVVGASCPDHWPLSPKPPVSSSSPSTSPRLRSVNVWRAVSPRPESCRLASAKSAIDNSVSLISSRPLPGLPGP